jgi:hypothetical protein
MEGESGRQALAKTFKSAVCRPEDNQTENGYRWKKCNSDIYTHDNIAQRLSYVHDDKSKNAGGADLECIFHKTAYGPRSE